MNRMIAEDRDAQEVDIPAVVWQNRIKAFSRDRKTRKIKAREFAIEELNLPEGLAQDIYDAAVIGWTYFYHQEFVPGTTYRDKEPERSIEERTRISAF